MTSSRQTTSRHFWQEQLVFDLSFDAPKKILLDANGQYCRSKRVPSFLEKSQAATSIRIYCPKFNKPALEKIIRVKVEVT
jgi:hypothetical protein